MTGCRTILRAACIIAVLALTPALAHAQAQAPAAPPPGQFESYKWMAIAAGAVGGVVLLNVVTGGAALAPLTAAAFPAAEAGIAGGAGAGAAGAAAAAAARQAACRWSAIVSSAIAGAFVGNWAYGG